MLHWNVNQHTIVFVKNASEMLFEKCLSFLQTSVLLTHWGRVTNICVSNLDHHKMACHLIGAKPISQPMLPHFQLDPILETNFSDSLFRFQKFSTKMQLKMSSAKCRPFCLGWSSYSIPELTRGVMNTCNVILRNNCYFLSHDILSRLLWLLTVLYIYLFFEWKLREPLFLIWMN